MIKTFQTAYAKTPAFNVVQGPILNPGGGAGVTKVLFLGGSAGPTSGDDGFVMTHLQNRYGVANVTYKEDGGSVTADADGMSIIVISSSVGSGSIRNKFNLLAIGILNWERILYEDSVGDFIQTTTRTDVTTTDMNVVLDTHPIAVRAGLSNGTVVIGGSASRGVATGTISAGTSVISEVVGAATQKMVFASEKGGLDVLGGTYPGRRIGFPQTGSGFNTLNAVGKATFDACLDWCQGII